MAIDQDSIGGRYTCGCDRRTKLIRYSSKRIENGIEVCPEHGALPVGFLSPQIGSPNSTRIDYSKFSTYDGVLNVDFSKPDQRDTRDPSLIGVEILRNKKILFNGNEAITTRDN